MTTRNKCSDCASSQKCQGLLGSSYREAGPCDWAPSRFVQVTSRQMTTEQKLETLERAERWARTCASTTAEEAGTEAAALGCRLLALIAAELDRLRATVARLEAELAKAKGEA